MRFHPQDGLPSEHMFPSFLTRAAGAALDLADAMLEPHPGGDQASPPPERHPQASTADHPHRRPPRSRAVAAWTRRPGALPRATQPCTTPIVRSSRLTQRAPAA